MGVYYNGNELDTTTKDMLSNKIINKIVLQEIDSKVFENIFGIFTKKQIDNGFQIEEIEVANLTATDFDPTGADALKKANMDFKTLYHKINRYKTYKATISNAQIKRSMLTKEGVAQIATAITNEIFNSAAIDDFEAMKQLLADVANHKKAMVICDLNGNGGDMDALTKAIQTLATNMTLPSTLYNFSGYKKEFNKNIVNTMARCSEIMREEEEFLNKEAKKFYEKCEVEKNRIDIEKLKEIDRVLERRIIRIGFLEFTPDLYDISYEHTESVLALIEKESGKVIELPKGLRVKREHNCIYFYKEEEKNSFNYKIDVDKMYSFDEIGVGILLSREKNIENCKKSYTIDIDCDKINSDIVLRSRKAGDKINLLAGSKSVKRLFIDEKIPASKRDSIPLLAVDSNVIWIKDLKTSSYFMANENSRNILYLHLWEV